ncbi:MAG: acetyl-CoA carboxylase biotin carboxyl carrier protein [bacterium]
MDINTIRKLIKLVEDSNITEFSVQEGDLKIKISKNKDSNVLTQQIPFANYTVPNSSTNAAFVNEQKNLDDIAKISQDDKLHPIKSPIVGTFYRSPSPGLPEFVKVGDRISQGTVLCIVEAMKLMNEIESDVSGTVVKVLIEDGSPVEYNQPLFSIQKD